MTYAEQLAAERKARLERIESASIRRKAIKELSQVLAEQRELIADIQKEADIPEVVGEWISRQRAITAELKASVQEAEHARPTVAKIQARTADYFAVNRDDMLSARRTANVVHPRQVAYFLCKAMTLRSLPDIGRKFGGRDHTTVLHGIRKIERLIRKDWQVAYDVAQIEESLR